MNAFKERWECPCCEGTGEGILYQNGKVAGTDECPGCLGAGITGILDEWLMEVIFLLSECWKQNDLIRRNGPLIKYLKPDFEKNNTKNIQKAYSHLLGIAEHLGIKVQDNVELMPGESEMVWIIKWITSIETSAESNLIGEPGLSFNHAVSGIKAYALSQGIELEEK